MLISITSYLIIGKGEGGIVWGLGVGGTIVDDEEAMLSSCGEGVRKGSSSSSVWVFLSIAILSEAGSGLGSGGVSVCILKDDFLILAGESVCML